VGVLAATPRNPANDPILIIWLTQMAGVNRKPLTAVQRVGKVILLIGAAVFFIGIAPFLVLLLLMATHIVDPKLNPVGEGVVFSLSSGVFVVLMLIGVFCRFLISD
jgi:hypothetical protein